MTGSIIEGVQIDKDVDATIDVCIVGSGAGGAVLAAGLSDRGLSVIVLEEGGYFQAKDFELHESAAFANLYQQAGLRSTVDKAVTVLQGRTVGGTTTINWTSSFRTPKRILDHWRSVHGVDTLDPETLRPHFEAVEQRLNIAPWPVERQNANNQILWRGAEKLKWHRGQIARNVKTCMNSGYCGFGCPVDAKQSMHLTYLPDAIAKGATIYADTRADRIEVDGRRAVAVHASVLDRTTGRPTGRKVTVKPKLLAVCGGAINTPVLLHRSNLDNNGRVGRRSFFHLATGISGFYEETIRPFAGAPQSVYSHEFQDRGPGKLGFFMEVAPLFPMLTAAAMGGSPAEHQQTMMRLPNMSMIGVLMIDGLLPEEQGATVKVGDDGRLQIDYPLTELHWEAFRAATAASVRAHLAAGATEVRTLHGQPVVMRSEADIKKLDAAAWAPVRFPIFTFHQMGGAAMGKDPAQSVVDPHLKHHAFDNMFVVDGSVLPTSLGVNPSETIYAIAHWAAEHIAKAV